MVDGHRIASLGRSGSQICCSSQTLWTQCPRRGTGHTSSETNQRMTTGFSRFGDKRGIHEAVSPSEPSLLLLPQPLDALPPDPIPPSQAADGHTTRQM